MSVEQNTTMNNAHHKPGVLARLFRGGKPSTSSLRGASVASDEAINTNADCARCNADSKRTIDRRVGAKRLLAMTGGGTGAGCSLATTGGESQRSRFSTTGNSGRQRLMNGKNTSVGAFGARRRFVAAVTALVLALPTMTGVFGFNATPAVADDLTSVSDGGTVPDNGGNPFYSNEVHTILGDRSLGWPYGPGYGPYTVPGVYQSQSTTSATDFAAGLPLGTIFIDQSKIGDRGGKAEIITKDKAILAGLVKDYTWGGYENYVGYDGRQPGAIPLEPGKIIRLDGDLFTVTFEDAAILPNGTRADLVATFSNARIVIDQRYAYAPEGERYYHGTVLLAHGNSIATTGTDMTDLSAVGYASAAQNAVSSVVQGYNGYDPFDNTKAKLPAMGTSIDTTYKIVNKDGTPAAGTFVFAIAGINLDRDPGAAGGNNAVKPLWYSYDENFGGEDGREYSYFSEAMSINGGQASKNIYVRPNNALYDNPANTTDYRGNYFYPNITEKSDGTIKFTSNSDTGGTNYSGSDNSYNSGFVTLADAAQGFKITRTGHGGGAITSNLPTNMNSLVFNSKQIWYRYTESTGKHGSIAITREGNADGKLGDGSAVYEPEGVWDKGIDWDGADSPSGIGEAATHVVTEGKTVTYTMTPDIGYKIGKLWIGDTWNENGVPTHYTEVEFNSKAVSAMKKGDSQQITTAADRNGLLTYNADGTYSLKFEYAKHNEAVHVEWEPTTADILVAKVWDDEDDKDGLRAAAYAEGATKPKFKLEYSTNRGGEWNEVTNNSFAGVTAHPVTSINQQDIPDGKDPDTGKYLDGTYPLNNGDNKHPYTWEYLPVYTYDDNGVADKAILYRLVEIPDPAIADYEDAKYADSQSFELLSSKNQSVDGWLIMQDSTDNKQYIKKGDGQYYEVDPDTGVASDTPATTQPKASNLKGVQSNSYYTVDKGIAYFAVQAKNEHKPREVYIDLTKFWNDKVVQELTQDPDDNAYGRRDITFVLHGETTDGPVDLNGNPNDDILDREITITMVGENAESDDKTNVTGDKIIEGHTVYKDASNNEYALVTGNSEHEDGYYPIANDAVDYENGPVSGLTGLTIVPKGDGTYKIDNDHFGALIEHLSTHYAGKPITYTVTEKIGGQPANTNEAINSADLPWTTTGGNLSPVENSSGEIIGYTTEFVNTPVVDKKVNLLSVNIVKQDKLTNVALENATFTVYTNAVSKEKATKYGPEKIGDQRVYTNDIDKYVKQGDTYYLVNEDGTVATEAADPQPNEHTLRVSSSGAVDANEVTTDAQGTAIINFREPGTYYVVETKAPTGYDVDPTTYTFVVEDELKSVTLTDADEHHDTSFWESIYDLLFNTQLTTDAPNWSYDGEKGTLTVKDDPIRANILINKVWDDNNNQDGLRTAGELPEVRLEKTTDPTDETSWAPANSTVTPAEDKQIPAVDAPMVVDQDNYYTWDNLPAYENGKLIYYRVVEFGGSLPADKGGVFLPDPDQVDHPEEIAYAWTALTATGNQEEFNIAKETTTETGTTTESTNRTVTVTNKHVPQLITLNVTKNWADENGDTSKRKTAKITLYKTVNGAESVVTERDNSVPTEPSTETTFEDFTTFEDLPVYENGYPITYRVEETAIDHYGTTYKTSYTPAGATEPTTGDGNSLDVSTVKRTWDEDTRKETTEATFNVKNARLTEVIVEKTWFDGATENVIYRVYRTTNPAVAEWNTENTNWDPESDTTNWELVRDEDNQPITVAFAASDFANKSVAEGGSKQEYTIQNLPVADPDGKTYTYRVYELNSDTVDKFEANQVSNTKVENTNARATDGLAHVNVVKELKGRDWNNNDTFYFQIEPYEDGSGSVDYGHAGACGVDQNGNDITGADCSAIPLPKDNDGTKDVEDVKKSDTQVGAIGRNVAFTPIQYTSADVDMGKTAEYYYKVYEVYKDENNQIKSLDEVTNHTGIKDGISYDGEVVSGEFQPTEHTLKVVVSSDSVGVITTTLYWDGATTPSAVPVYTNTYDASAEIHAYIIKQVQGRQIVDGDVFNFSISNIGGAPLRAHENDDATIETDTHNTGSIEYNTGTKVQSGTSGYDPVDGEGGNFRAFQSGSSNWFKVGDLSQKTADGRATDTFIYRLIENSPDASSNPSVANEDDLNFDTSHIYIKIVATDNLDGTLDIQKSYWYDETCTQEVPSKVLVDADGAIAPADADPDAEDGEGNKLYHYEPAALFTNDQTVDISVVKEWKGGPAIEDVTLRLQRKLIPLAAEQDLDYASAEEAVGYNNEGWKDVGNMTIAQRGDFMKADGTPNYNSLSPLTATKTYENVSGFNKDLPKYVTIDGVTYRAVYKLVEDKTSDAYTTTYRSEGGVKPANGDGNQIFIDGETLVVTNTVTATNEANIAAVKQLLGRQWLASDDFEFTLEPAGKGTYKSDGSFDGIDDSDDAKAVVPMPEDNDARESVTTGTGADTVATTHAKKGDGNGTDFPVVDPNGNLERLARFGAITFDVNDLTWVNNHYEGDFFYTMKEKVPEGATEITGDDNKTYYVKDGITYDGLEHTVHVKVQGNRTDKLYVQIGYDESTVGDTTTGTQFTPVYTNRYDASGTEGATIHKYVMGRDFAENETFTFKITPLGEAPMVDPATGNRLDNREGTITVSDTSKTPQELKLPDIKFVLDDLSWTVGANGTPDNRDNATEVTYSDGTTPVAGMKYGRFMYAFTETGASSSDLTLDTDTEYVQVTVIDKGDGTLDTQVKYFEDRYGTKPRIKPGTQNDPAEATAFVNKLKRDLSVTKAWDAPATSDVTLKLQWTTDGTTWNDAEGTDWLAGFEGTKVIAQDATGADLTVKWEGLPAYAPDDDDIDLNDKWVRYRVVEDSIANVTTGYSTEAYADDDTVDTEVNGEAKYSANPIATETEGDELVDHTYVTNFVNDLEGTASVNVVKQLIGRGWTNTDSFGFTITAVESKLGGEDTAVSAEDRAMPMPIDNDAVDNTATASTSSTQVTLGEYNATFKPIVIKLSQLAIDPADNVAKGEFIYTIKEAIPEGAEEITGTDGKTYYVKNNIKYTAAEHTVKIVATNDGTGTIDTTVSYDGRPAGDFVPVYTNEAVVPTPISGTKTWVGGEADEHVNANNGTDALGITLQRKTSADADWTTLTADDAGRTLLTLWENETGDSPYYIKVQVASGENPGFVDPVLDMMDDSGYRYEYRIVEGTVPDDYAVSYTTTTVTNDTITNTSTKKDSLKVTKVWDDGDDAEGLRPDKVVMHLYKQVTGDDGTSVVQVEVATKEIVKPAGEAQNEWTTGITWNDLPVYDAAGNKITYVVIEEAEYGYATTYKVLGDATVTDYTETGNSLTLDGDTTADPQTIDVKNTLVPATDTVSVTKVWNDDNNRDGKRPGSVSVNVYEHVWTDASGETPAGYAKNDTAVATIVLDGTVDDSATGTGITTQETSAWTGTVNNLPRTKNGRTVFYTVGEDVSDTGVFGAAGTEGKYSDTPVVTGNQVDGFTVTNEYTPETVDIQATKVWGDLALQLLAPFGYDRPTTVSFQLQADGTPVGSPVAVNKDSKVGTTEWAYQWTDLPKYKNGGTEIAYTVTEINVPSGYTPSYTGNITDGFTVTNTVAKNDVTVQKQFLDAETREPIPASSIPVDFVIHANYTAVENDARVVKNVELAIDDAVVSNGTYMWTLKNVVPGTTVHVHENNYRDADKYTFTQVTTTGPDDDAKIHVDDTNFLMPNNEGATVKFVNEYKKQTGNLELVKNWNDDGNRDGKRPGEVSFTVTATVGENQPADVFVSGESATNTTTVKLNEAGGWTDASLTGLPLYDANGNQITYTLSEPTVPEGYANLVPVNPSATLTEGATATLSITNTHIPAMDSLTVTKNWTDGNDAAGLRPDNVTFHLYKTVSGGADVSAGVDAKTVSGNGSATWTGLPVYEGGEKITYKVIEESVAGYTTTYSAAQTVQLDGVTTREATQEDVDADLAENVGDPITVDPQEVTVTNTLAGETTSVNVTKVWDDGDDVDGLRPESVDVKVYEHVWTDASGETPAGYVKNTTPVHTFTLEADADGNWTDTKADLPAIKNGKPVMYSVVETQVSGYEAPVVTGNQVDGFTVTNTHKPVKGCVEVKKVWEDNDNQDGKRANAVMTLKATTGTGENAVTQTVGEKTISADMSKPQEAEWHNLPVYRNGQKITYTVEEAAIEGYTTTYSDAVQLAGDNDTKTLTVTNTRTPATTSVTATKRWNDGNNQDGMRADVTLHLKGTIAGSDFVSMNFADKTVATGDNHDQNMTATWTGLPTYHDGKAITYSVVEEAIPGYTASVSDNQDGSFTVTNSRTPATTSVSVTKVWDDNSNVDGKRANAIVRLDKTVGGTTTQDVKVESLAVGAGHTQNMTVTWDNLPAYENGQQIIYTVREDAIDGYTTQITGDPANGYTITNIHTPETTTATVTKSWQDNNNAFGTRPDSVTMHLYKKVGNTGSYVDTGKKFTVAADDRWTATIEGLPAYELASGESKAVSYFWKEDVPAGYEATYSNDSGYEPSGGQILNTLKTHEAYVQKFYSGISELPDGFTLTITYTDLEGNEQTVTQTKNNSEDEKSGEWMMFEGVSIPYGSKVTVTESGYDVAGKQVASTSEVLVTSTDTPLGGAELSNTSATFTMPDINSGYVKVVIRNTYIDSDNVTIPVAKVWDDADNQDKKRPETVTFRLFANGEDTGKTVTLSATDVASDDANRWAKTEAFTVPGFDEAGTLITYTVREDVSRELATAGYTDSGEAGAAQDYTITNTYTPSAGEVLGDETWGGINEAQTGVIDWNVNPNNPVTPGELVVPEGGTLNSDGTVTVNGGTYKLNDDGTITFNPKADWYGDPTPITVKGTDRQGNEVTATYTPHVVNNIETDDVTRTITYTYAKDGSEASAPVTQTVRFTRIGTVNPNNGEVTYKEDGSDWTVVGDNPEAANFAKVDSPDIEGYNPDRDSVPAVTVQPGDDDITEEVVYSDQIVLTPAEITVVKVDTAGKPLAGAEFTLSDPYGTEFTKVTGKNGTVTFRLDAEGSWSLVETGVPENHKLGDVYSWTIKVKVDEGTVRIEKVTEGDDTLWKKFKELFIDLTAEGYNAATSTLTVENQPLDEKTITYVDPDPEDPTKEKVILEDTIKVGENEPGQPGDPTRDGYEFGGWLREMDENGNVIYKAKWIKIPEPGEKVIEYIDPSKPEGEQEVLREVITRGDNEPGQPGDPTRDGWKFIGWKRTIDDDGNVTYTAQWEEIPEAERVTVIYDYGNGEDSDTYTINRNENEPGQPADPTREGFKFVGWQRVEDENGNVTYTAQWEEIPEAERIVITYEYGNGADPTSTTIERGDNEPGQPADPTRDGYEFGGWMREVDKDGNVTYKARWIKKPPTETITVTRDPGNGEPPTSVEIIRGENEPGQPVDPTREGYEFAGWDRSFDADGNVTYKARWNKITVEPTDTVTITYDPANGDEATSTDIERGANEPGQPKNLTRDGYIFGGWLREQDGDGNVRYTANWIEEKTCPECPTPSPCPSVTPTEDPTVDPTPTGDPTPETIWVTYVDGDGKVYVEKTTIAKGADEPAAPANPERGGYVFDGWDRTVDENGNITYTARWKKMNTPTPSTPIPSNTPAPPAVSQRPLPTTPLSKTGGSVGAAGITALMLAGFGGFLTLRRRRAVSVE
ncbi:MAG: Cna B-type domain-containing protein [Actinomycetaceae bacterium]|nr:Cna B-type domain-containing protein [Actinomycetaceae bacterium]